MWLNDINNVPWAPRVGPQWRQAQAERERSAPGFRDRGAPQPVQQPYTPPPFQPPAMIQSGFGTGAQLPANNPLQIQQQSYFNTYRPPAYKPFGGYGGK